MCVVILPFDFSPPLTGPHSINLARVLGVPWSHGRLLLFCDDCGGGDGGGGGGNKARILNDVAGG